MKNYRHRHSIKPADFGEEEFPPAPLVYHRRARDVAAAILLILVVAFLVVVLVWFSN